ncbi:MAG: hypothetical protein HY805_09220 [Nitrospirae bacterium]|nr:hypothetical protein [Nitrospirota bacterium]
MMKKNLWLKVSALLFAIVMWLFVVSKEQTMQTIDVQVEFKNLPEELEIIGDNIPIITVNLKGPERLLKNITPSSIHIYVDMSNAKLGRQSFTIRGQTIRVPAFLKVAEINPSSISVTTSERKQLKRNTP